MGFFSWNCKGCGESIKAPYDIPDQIAWQNEAVVINSDNTMVSGPYDGYGRIEGYWADNEFDPEPEMWHGKCYAKAAQPLYSGPSDYAEDQGFFYYTPSQGKGNDCDE